MAYIDLESANRKFRVIFGKPGEPVECTQIPQSCKAIVVESGGIAAEDRYAILDGRDSHYRNLAKYAQERGIRMVTGEPTERAGVIDKNYGRLHWVTRLGLLIQRVNSKTLSLDADGVNATDLQANNDQFDKVSHGVHNFINHVIAHRAHMVARQRLQATDSTVVVVSDTRVRVVDALKLSHEQRRLIVALKIHQYYLKPGVIELSHFEKDTGEWTRNSIIDPDLGDVSVPKVAVEQQLVRVAPSRKRVISTS